MIRDNGMTAHDWNVLGEEDPLWAILSDPQKRDNKWNFDEFFSTGRSAVTEMMEEISTKKYLASNHKALDFGCGVGRLTQALADYFHESVGVDISRSMITRAVALNKKSNCRYILLSNNGLNVFNDNGFDFIYTILVLQHILPEDSKKYLREFVRILKPGGLLVFQLPSHLISGEKHVVQSSILFRMVKAIRVFLTMVWRSGAPSLPSIRMYGIPKADIISFLQQCGANSIHLKADSLAGKEWVSYTYYVKK